MPQTLIVMRLADMEVVHPQQDNSHKCGRCQHQLGMYPSGQAALRKDPSMEVVCQVCGLLDKIRHRQARGWRTRGDGGREPRQHSSEAHMTEKQQAFDLANAVLDKPHIDPDGDIAMLARQFLRAREEIDAMREALEPFAKAAEYFEEERAGWYHREFTWTSGDIPFGMAALIDARAVLANFTVPEVPRK